jgi:hypothetical protein
MQSTCNLHAIYAQSTLQHPRRSSLSLAIPTSISSTATPLLKRALARSRVPWGRLDSGPMGPVTQHESLSLVPVAWHNYKYSICTHHIYSTGTAYVYLCTFFSLFFFLLSSRCGAGALSGTLRPAHSSCHLLSFFLYNGNQIQTRKQSCSSYPLALLPVEIRDPVFETCLCQ